MDNSWLDSRITATKTAIESYEAAHAALASGTVDTFTIDTGQTRQVVTKKNMSGLEAAINAAYNRLAVLEARRYGSGIQARPRW